MRKFKKIIKNHHLALAGAILVGLIYLAPYVVFRISLGEKYQSIPMLATANEDFYLARIQEIVDGHPLLGSIVFYDYKDQLSLTPPTAEMFYAVPSILLGAAPADILIASKFILPFILFLLVYYLIYRLVADSDSPFAKFNAIAGGLFVTLGYDLVNYRSLWLFLSGQSSLSGNFLLWSRPVNPILGAIFLFSFFICLWSIIRKSRCRKSLIFLAAVFLALMISSYFFAWGVAVSVAAALILFYFFKKDYQTVTSFLWVALLAVIMSLPYWYMNFKVSQNIFYKDAILRNGLFYTHYPLLNKVILAALLFYFILFIPLIIIKLKLIFKDRLSFIKQFSLTRARDWNLFCLALLLGGLWALNQQVITGMTVWPFHFVQYTIPLSMVVVMTLLYNVIKEKSRYLWLLISAAIFSSSLIFGIATQTSAYRLNYEYYSAMQSYKPIINWLNQQEKDSVVLVAVDDILVMEQINGLIPAFTHCNIYASNWAYNLMQPDRMRFNYLVLLRLKGVPAGGIEEYLEDNQREVAGYLYSNWKGLYNVKQFPDFSDELLAERIKNFPENYRQFIEQDFFKELKKYRLDYILSIGPLNERIKKDLPQSKLIKQIDDKFIYQLAD